jgi:hypothetical protein
MYVIVWGYELSRSDAWLGMCVYGEENRRRGMRDPYKEG